MKEAVLDYLRMATPDGELPRDGQSGADLVPTDFAIDSIRTEGDWAVLSVHPVYAVDIGIEGFVVIAHYDTEKWGYAKPGEPSFRRWLELLPTTLLDDDHKVLLR